jgi:hypothetical protein
MLPKSRIVRDITLARCRLSLWAALSGQWQHRA